MATTRELKKQLNQIAAQIQEIDPEEEIEELKQTAKEYMQNAQEKWEQAKGKAKETAQNVDTYAKDNPWKVAGVAAGVGLIIGLLISTRNRD
jgi:ElaB/YqjD/DUF883 family membrane-anchored ribosome-binding protein